MKKGKRGKSKISSSKKLNKSPSINTKKEKKKFIFDWKIWILLGLVVILTLVILVNSFFNLNGNVITGNDVNQNALFKLQTDNSLPVETPTTEPIVLELTEWDNILNGLEIDANPVFAIALRAILGQPVQITSATAFSTAVSACVLTLCVWLLIFITFANVLRDFSSFSKYVCYVLGFLFATIMVQFNWQVKLIGLLASITGTAGMSLFFVVILSAFALFFIANVGIFPKLAKVIKKSNTARKAASIEAAGTKIAQLRKSELEMVRSMEQGEEKDR
jgi:hypothetical protein